MKAYYAQQLEDITGLGFEIIPKPCSPELLAEALARVIDRGRSSGNKTPS